MNGSNSDLERLVTAGRHDAAPSGARRRIKSSVLARVGVSVLTASSIGTVASSSAASGLFAGGKVVWIAVSLLVAGGLATGVVVHERSGPSTQPATTVAARAIAPARALAREPSPSTTPPQAPPVVSAPALGEKSVEPGQAPPRSGASATGAADALEKEVSLLREANAALGAGDAQRALQILTQHGKQFPRGALAEERRAIMAVAECRAHPGPASFAHAQEFSRHSPNSPLIERVRAACGH